MAQVVVTGGGGFIASHLIDALLSKGENVLAIDVDKNIPQRLLHLSNCENFKYLSADVRNKQELQRIIPWECKKIFHLAAVVGVKNYCDDPLKTIDVNIGGLRNIIDVALPNNSKIIFASTSEIYGKNPDIPWHEEADRVLGPTSVDRWSYASSKAVCEHMLFGMYRKYNLPMAIVRFFNVYGPRQNPIFVIPAMIYNVLNGKNPYVYDSGKQTRCFTFIDDAIDGMIKASENPMAEGKVFNIGSSLETKIIDVARMIIEIAGKSNELEPELINPRDVYGSSYEDISRRIPDTNKAKRILDWETKTNLESGLKKTIDFFRVTSGEHKC